eukprot:g8616.t1 g8616   contig3:500456-501555(+)
MGIKQDTEDSLKDFEFTKIDGQPMDEDLNQLTKECINAAASISTTNGGGQHGHVGMIIDDAEYILFSHNAARFVTPTNPGPYPATVDPDAAIRERQVAEHKAEKAEFETYLGVENFLRKAIIKVVDPEWIAELESESMGFNHRSPKEILAYLRAHGGDLDHLDVTELIQQPHCLREETRLSATSGEFEPSIHEWKAKPVADRTFTNFRIFMQKAFTDRNKHNKSTAQSTGRGIANSATDATMGKVDEAEAAALAIAEVAMVMQSNQEKQFQQMMEMFKEFMHTNVPGAPSQASVPTQSKQRKVCPHCKRPHVKPDKCWELEANKADRPANWKPAAERQPKAQS